MDLSLCLHYNHAFSLSLFLWTIFGVYGLHHKRSLLVTHLYSSLGVWCERRCKDLTWNMQLPVYVRNSPMVNKLCYFLQRPESYNAMLLSWLASVFLWGYKATSSGIISVKENFHKKTNNITLILIWVLLDNHSITIL